MKRSEDLGDLLHPGDAPHPRLRSVDLEEPRTRATGRAWVQVHLARLKENTQRIRRVLAPYTELMAVVKADAYGHGSLLSAMSAIEAGASSLGVATVDEGIALREAGIEVPILLLGYAADAEQVRLLAEHQIDTTLCSCEHALEIAKWLSDLRTRGALERRDVPLRVHLKFNTGMGRLGEHWEKAGEFFKTVLEMKRWFNVVGLYSHFACADAPDPTSMREQQCRFDEIRKRADQAGCEISVTHLANTAATLTSPQYHYDMVRIGLALYGMCPAPHLERSLKLEPVLEVKARITQVRDVKPGDSISYGSHFVAAQPLRVATVGIGYADGVSMRLSGRIQALLRGRRVRQLGRITMDQLVIDVTGIEGAQSGDVVTLIGTDGGETVSVTDWARELDTIPWEVLCLFNRRLPRVSIE